MRSLVHGIGTALFLGLLVIPFAASLRPGNGPHSLMEQRVSPPPALKASPSTWRPWFDVVRSGYLDKTFAYREQLITASNYLNVWFISSSDPGAPVVRGRGDWLFLNRDGERKVLEDYLTGGVPPKAALDALAADFAGRRDTLAKMGIRYLVMVAPNKNSIYPERLSHTPATSEPQAALEACLAAVRAAGVEVLDLREPLLAAKATGQVFYATDSHWNAQGAFESYRFVMERLKREFPQLSPSEPGDFFRGRIPSMTGDLAFMVGLSELVHEEAFYFQRKARPRATSLRMTQDLPGLKMPLSRSRVDDAGLPSVVFLHDSYFSECQPYFAEHFRNAAYLWLMPSTKGAPRAFPLKVFEQEKPDIVIEQYAERFFVPPKQWW